MVCLVRGIVGETAADISLDEIAGVLAEPTALLAEGARRRQRGEDRGGFIGRESHVRSPDSGRSELGLRWRLLLLGALAVVVVEGFQIGLDCCPPGHVLLLSIRRETNNLLGERSSMLVYEPTVQCERDQRVVI